MQLEQINGGYAALAVDSGDTPTQGSQLVHGVAIGEGDITIGGSGKRTYWPRETLQEAAEGLEGQPLATDTNHTADNPKPQTPVEAIAGEVVWAGYKDGVGVLYEAEVDDPELAEKIENGRLEVSPLVSREIEAMEDGPAPFKATEINHWRDLALVANGAAPSNSIQPGEAPTAEALHKTIESLQEPGLSDSVDVPERIQNAAQAALDADEDGLIPDSCGTGTGTSRAQALADNDVQVNDFLTRGDDDKTPIPAYLNSHAEDATTTDPPTEWGEDEWESCGNAGLARWGWYGDWFKSKANELSRQRDEQEPYESMSAEALQLDEARTPAYDGTESADWSEVSKDLSDVTSAAGIDAETVDDLSGEQKQAIADHTLLGDPEADVWNELFFFPVVNPSNQNLNENALDAVRGGRGAQADIPEDTYDSAEEMARTLLAEEFDREFESMADVSDVDEGTLVKWNSSGERDAYGMVEEVRTEGDDPLDSEIDGDQTINPPAALITVHTPGEDGWTETETQVGHTLNTDTLEVIDELPDAESLAKHEDESMQDVPDEFIFDNPGSAMSKAQDMGFEEIHTHGEGSDTVFMPGPTHSDLMDMIQSDDGQNESMAPSSVVANSDRKITMDNISESEVAVLEAAESLDAPAEALQEFAAAEQPTVVEQDTYEAMRGVLTDALSERAELKESTIEALSFSALVDEFRDDDGDLQAEALVQSPESRTPDADKTEALSDDADTEKAEALYADYQTFGNEALKSDIKDALGVSDWDTATEVLD